MNLAFVHRRFDNMGGTERDLLGLTRQLAGFGHEVHLYCGEFRVTPDPNLHVHKVPYLRLGGTAKLLSFAYFGPKMAYKGQHDLVISFGRVLRQDITRCGGGSYRVLLNRLDKVRSPYKKLTKWLNNRLALQIEKIQYQKNHYRKIIAISQVVKNELMETYHIPTNDIEVIYDGIDLELFHPRNRQTSLAEIRTTHQISQEKIVLLFVGRGFSRKGLKNLLSVMPKMDDRFHLLVVGGDNHLESYRDLCNDLNIGSKVTFAGSRTEIHKYYGASDLFILPSFQEAFGNVILEAMASGLPVITTLRAGASEVIQGELRDFLLADPDDINDMKHKIELLAVPDKLKRLGEMARQIAQNYTIESNARSIEALCRSLLQKSKE